MQQITRSDLVLKAKELLKNGTVSRVLGWQKGEFFWDVTPAVFETEEELESSFVWNDFCGANLSKYLIKETAKSKEAILVFLKPCDTYSFNQLLTEHRFDRERVYAVGVPCDGMMDEKQIKKVCESATGVELDGEKAVVHTLYDGDAAVKRNELLSLRCTTCKSKKHVAYDILLGSSGEVCENGRFDKVSELEAMTSDERYAFWQNELSRCIRCNACRDVCPACTCEKCVFDNRDSGVENKAAADSFEEKMFHIIRAFHVAGRCTDCGECSRVCPQSIPLHLLNRKFIKDINTLYGEYQAGETVGSRASVVDFDAEHDAEPNAAESKGGV